MQCPKCPLEMWVTKVENDTVYYECKRCGTTQEVPIKELEHEEESNEEENNEDE